MKQVRQQEIIDLINEEGFVSTEALAAHFDVSSQTIRRDLDALERQGILIKMYGGATLVGRETDESSFSFFNYIPSTDHQEEKEAIARKAISYVNDGATIAVDIGSTTRMLGRELNKKNNLVIITKDVLLATALFEHPTNKVYLVGGFMGERGTTSGEFLKEFLESVSKVDVFFLSTDGVTVNEGFTNDLAAVEVYRSTFLSQSNLCIALADSTKFGKTSFYRSCGITEVDSIITDSKLNPTILEEMRQAGASIELA